MRTILATFLILLLLHPVSAFGEIQTVTHTVKQPFGGSQSPDDARIAAVAKARREALEMAGIYIESLTVVKDSHVDKDEILALAAGVLKAEVVSQKNYASEDAFGIDVVVKVVVDTSVLEVRVKKLLQDKTHLEQLNKARKKEKELLEKIAVLENENRKRGLSDQASTNLKKGFQEASRGLTAVDWVKKSIALHADGEYTDHGKATEYLNEAIRLNPDYAVAYALRGLHYAKLEQYKLAIKDFNEVIRLEPDDWHGYSSRGLVYYLLEQYLSAIKDFDSAIRLKPGYSGQYPQVVKDNGEGIDPDDPYFFRGDAYAKLGQHQRAIEDFNEVIHMKPDYAMAYSQRGVAYNELGQHQRAIEDYKVAIRLKPDYAYAVTKRGEAYAKLGQHQQAIKDYDEAIRLKPDMATFTKRGNVYNELGQFQAAIKDYDEAIRLKPDMAAFYVLRGLAYLGLKQYHRAIRDYDEAIRLKPNIAYTFIERGNAYRELRQYRRAIKDYDEAIRLKPDDAKAYNMRGLNYLLLKKNKLACRDFKKACSLGSCEGLDTAKDQELCR